MARYFDNQAIAEIDELYRRQGLTHKMAMDLMRKKFLGVWVNPTLLNGWTTAVTGEAVFKYRLVFDDFLMVTGTLDSGSSGTIAFILPEPWRPRDGNIHISAHVVSAGVAGARLDVDATTGEVTVNF